MHRELAAKCELKERIYIGAHDIVVNEDSFGRKDGSRFDGLHMSGQRGCKMFTASLVNILSKVLTVQPSTTRVFSDEENFPKMKQPKSFTPNIPKDDNDGATISDKEHAN